MDNIKVSVICLTYNHQKYIRQCLESLVNQETDFNYEIIVHDDASTDNTADIVREFEKQYPEKMITIYQTENQYSKNVKITRNYIFPIVRGKYIAYCEGDDFWTDNHKLQIQFDAMEKNNKLRFCVHRVLTCDESGTAANTFFPESFSGTQIIDSYDFITAICGSWEFQLTSFFIRYEDFRRLYLTQPHFFEISPAGDIAFMMYYGNLGDILFIEKAMSCYRLNSIGSWTTRNRDSDNKKRIEIQNRFIDTWLEFDKYSCYKYHDSILKGIEFYYFNIYKFSSNYKRMSRECKNFLRKRSNKIRAYVFLSAYLPFFPWLVKKLFGRNPL